MKKINKKYIIQKVKSALKEDLFPNGDITSNLLNSKKKITAKIISNQNVVISGIDFARTAFQIIDKDVSFNLI